MSTFQRLADLSVQIDAVRLEGRSQRASGDFTRHTTVIRLFGSGCAGVGEDVNYEADEQQAFQAGDAADALAVAIGSRTLSELSERLDTVELFAKPPRQEASRDYRRWAIECAALDLALQQADTTLAARLDRAPQPVRFVASTGLGRPASTAPLRRLLDLQPELEFKLDAASSWDAGLIADIRSVARVCVVDFKGAYKGTIVDQDPDPELYARVVDGFPEAWLEDPHTTPECVRVLAAHQDRVTWDAPIHSVADIESLDVQPRCVNVKPSRFGSLRKLFDAYDHCERLGIRMYGGGQFELGPGRGQIQYLASLFHPDESNDVAPRVYNARELPATLPASPLAPRLAKRGFRWEATPPGTGGAGAGSPGSE